MMPMNEVSELAKWSAALAGSFLGLIRFLAGRRDTQQENEDTIECHTYILESLSDADRRAILSCVTGKDIREQLSVEEVERIAQDAERRRAWPKNN